MVTSSPSHQLLLRFQDPVPLQSRARPHVPVLDRSMETVPGNDRMEGPGIRDRISFHSETGFLAENLPTTDAYGANDVY